MLLPKAKLEFTCSSTTFNNGVFANTPWIRRYRWMNSSRQSPITDLNRRTPRRRWPTGHRPRMPRGGRTPALAWPVGPQQREDWGDPAAPFISHSLDLAHLLSRPRTQQCRRLPPSLHVSGLCRYACATWTTLNLNQWIGHPHQIYVYISRSANLAPYCTCLIQWPAGHTEMNGKLN